MSDTQRVEWGLRSFSQICTHLEESGVNVEDVFCYLKKVSTGYWESYFYTQDSQRWPNMLEGLTLDGFICSNHHMMIAIDVVKSFEAAVIRWFEEK